MIRLTGKANYRKLNPTNEPQTIFIFIFKLAYPGEEQLGPVCQQDPVVLIFFRGVLCAATYALEHVDLCML